jgi:hypothetical protein
MKLKTLSKKNQTNENGIFYKEIVDENNKVVDKIFLIRYREKSKDKLITIGKYSAGIRIAFCKQKRDEILNKVRLGEDIPIKHKKQTKGISFDEVYEKYIQDIELHATANTLREVKSKYKLHLDPVFFGEEVESITMDDLEELQKKKIKKL